MSCCWDCEKKNACGKLYTDGEQQYCEDKEKAYKSHEAYVRWLAKSGGFHETK